MPLDSQSSCAVGGDHPASGSRVEALCVPIQGPGLQQAYLLMQFCEKHLPQADAYPLRAGNYIGTIQIGYVQRLTA